MNDRIRKSSVLVLAVVMSLLTAAPWARAELGFTSREGLEKALKAAGYEVTLHEPDMCQIKFGESDGWKFDLNVRPAPDNQRIYIFARLQNLGPVETLPPKAVLDCLVGSSQYNPPYFMLVDRKTASELWLAYHFENTTENVGKIKDQVNVMANSLRKSVELWRPAKWGIAPATQPAAAPTTKPAEG